jgi:hypothetical protein
VEVRFPPFEEGFNVGINISDSIQLTTIVLMSEMIPAIRNQIGISSITPDVFNPSAAKSWIAIRTSELTSPIESNLQGL